MITAALLLSTFTVALPASPRDAVAQSTDVPASAVRHVFQNRYPIPLRLWWIDPQGKRVDIGAIAPGAYISLQTFVGHRFVLTDAKGRRRRTVRVGDVLTGTYIGTSRYRPVAVRRGWHVFVDQAVDRDIGTTRTALTTLARLLEQADATLPQESRAHLRKTPIFLHEHAGPAGMFHPDPDWLIAHGRTVEMLNDIEISDAGVFIETVKSQPGAVLHELAHAHYVRLSDEDRAEIDTAYRRAIENGLYKNVRRYDGSLADAYARYSASEYFAELSEAYFGRNDFYPFTRADLATYDPDGEGLLARLWR